MATSELLKIKQECVLKLLAMYKTANAGHIGASLSCLDLLLFLHLELCKKSSPRENDLVILSKGHAAGALYVALEAAGKIPAGSSDTFYKDGTAFPAHPPCNREFATIPFGTGSLGHGVGLGAGIALASKLKGSDKKVYVIVSDGELNEGSVWESLMFAKHHQLQNLCVIVDQNGLQGLGATEDILNLDPLDEKFKAFGFNVVNILNGNEFESIHAAFTASSAGAATAPASTIYLAKTTKGSGVSYMENKFEWHYLPMNEEQYKTAISETTAAGAKKSQVPHA